MKPVRRTTPTPLSTTLIRVGTAALGLGLLAACSGTGLSLNRVSPLTPAPSGQVTSAPLNAPSAPQPPPVQIAGRWTLAATDGTACGMTFGGAPGSGKGSVAPEGGCPGNFFTSRSWSYERDSLVILDHRGQPLGRLAMASPVQFSGQATNGQPITLTR